MEPVLETRDLCKRFLLQRKSRGFLGSLKSLWAPETVEVEAVRDVSFSVERGELLAFIGPNGAGKSTTIKMLTGILHPSSGSARVLGHVPWTERRRLSFRIGSVFGQKSQLWMHLPPVDSFRLLARIYEVPDARYRRRVGKLVELFELQEFMETPVRKLSLGQRMRCEIAAALVHEPEVIFLDEPTIGLDVIAKEKIRELARAANEEEGVTIFLTSHDAGDIEKLCKRVVIVDRGSILLDAKVQDLKRSERFGVRTVGARLSRPAEGFAMEGVEIVKCKGPGLKLRVDTAETPIEGVLEALMAYGGVEDLTVRNPSLEEIIAHIYRSKGLAAPAGEG